MSTHIQKNKSFLDLLLQTSKRQAKALLNTITSEQVLLIIEVIKNILELILPKKARYYVERKRKLLQKIIAKSISKTKKALLIKKHSSLLLLLFYAIKQQLLGLK